MKDLLRIDDCNLVEGIKRCRYYLNYYEDELPTKAVGRILRILLDAGWKLSFILKELGIPAGVISKELDKVIEGGGKHAEVLRSYRNILKENT